MKTFSTKTHPPHSTSNSKDMTMAFDAITPDMKISKECDSVHVMSLAKNALINFRIRSILKNLRNFTARSADVAPAGPEPDSTTTKPMSHWSAIPLKTMSKSSQFHQTTLMRPTKRLLWWYHILKPSSKTYHTRKMLSTGSARPRCSSCTEKIILAKFKATITLLTTGKMEPSTQARYGGPGGSGISGSFSSCSAKMMSASNFTFWLCTASNSLARGSRRLSHNKLKFSSRVNTSCSSSSSLPLSSLSTSRGTGGDFG
mmetsp:Transcript_80458/g.209135  ORF Transcript_80458/g.209135 Transcript_80458/m.209135 type:complete len:258 (+) Transcript_80458:347-1120(+)